MCGRNFGCSASKLFVVFDSELSNILSACVVSVLSFCAANVPAKQEEVTFKCSTNFQAEQKQTINTLRLKMKILKTKMCSRVDLLCIRLFLRVHAGDQGYGMHVTHCDQRENNTDQAPCPSKMTIKGRIDMRNATKESKIQTGFTWMTLLPFKTIQLTTPCRQWAVYGSPACVHMDSDVPNFQLDFLTPAESCPSELDMTKINKSARSELLMDRV